MDAELPEMLLGAPYLVVSIIAHSWRSDGGPYYRTRCFVGEVNCNVTEPFRKLSSASWVLEARGENKKSEASA